MKVEPGYESPGGMSMSDVEDITPRGTFPVLKPGCTECQKKGIPCEEVEKDQQCRGCVGKKGKCSVSKLGQAREKNKADKGKEKEGATSGSVPGPRGGVPEVVLPMRMARGEGSGAGRVDALLGSYSPDRTKSVGEVIAGTDFVQAWDELDEVTQRVRRAEYAMARAQISAKSEDGGEGGSGRKRLRQK